MDRRPGPRSMILPFAKNGSAHALAPDPSSPGPIVGRTRRLLLVTYHFPPSAAVATFRMIGFARHLPRFGWQVGVVAPPRVPEEPVDEALVESIPQDTTVFSAPYPQNLASKLARRYMHHGVWLPAALPRLIAAVNQFHPDAVLTSGPPHCVHLLGLILKRYYDLPWLACFR